MTLLTIRDLAVSFSRAGGEARSTVVNRISFTLERGKLTALVGESGSGKSVTAHSILRLLPQPAAQYDSGEILLEGTGDLLKQTEAQLRTVRGKRIGMIFQEPMTSLNPLHTIGKQLKEAITLHQPALSSAQCEARIHQLLDAVELGLLKTRLSAYPHELSGGQRQRVMIAMALANDPELLIADEPTTALDVTVQATILALLKKLQQERGMAVLLITHDLTLVRHVADNVLVMKDGHLVEQGPATQLFAAPQHAYTQALLAAIPDAHPAPAPQASPLVLQAEKVTVRFPQQKSWWGGVKSWFTAVDNIALQLQQQHALGIVGESGSGKTTLALALLRLLPAQGTVVFQGQALHTLQEPALRPLRKQLQFVFQDPFSSLNPRLTVGQILAEGPRAHNQPCDETRIGEALTSVGLQPEMQHRYPHEFSGGQRQRISLARALILKPTLLVLDEPTSALDVTTQGSIIALLKQLQAERGLSYIFISHDLRVIRSLCHHILVLKHGKLIEANDNATLFSAPQHEYTRTLLEAAYLVE